MRLLFLFILSLFCLGSCSKSSFLDKKPNTDLVVPTSLSDFQSLLDYDLLMGVTPVLGEMSADNFYLVYSFWQGLDLPEKNAYTWADDIYAGQNQIQDWDVPYQQVFYANVVLAGLPTITIDSSNAQQWRLLMGSALFMRAYAYHNLAQLFAPPYDSGNPGLGWGIPLRSTPDINAKTVRSSVQATYDSIISDLKTASSLLPAAFPQATRNRPSKPAALAVLARVYLTMRDYPNALIYADSALQLYNVLINYNSLPLTGNVPIPKLNEEALYQSSFLPYTQALIGTFYPGCVIDSNLYRSYDVNDLRRVIYYKINSVTQTPQLKGSYNGTNTPFSGPATDEVYLIKAECEAHAGDLGDAMRDLNTLLKNRYVAGKFTPLTAASQQEALSIIRNERRKELAFRGLRWSDLRRLNLEGANITIERALNGGKTVLAPNSDRYILPIPPDVIQLSGIAQNPR